MRDCLPGTKTTEVGDEQMQQRVGSDEADYWWYRAEELRARASGARDADACRALLTAAESCEHQARLLEEQRAKGESSRQKTLNTKDGTS
jgi:hypothetical protein